VYKERCDAGDETILVENVLLEAFAVLTRAPKPTRLPPHEAVRSLQESFGGAITVPIRRRLAWDTIHHTLSRGFAGARVYDAAIALAAYEAGARLLLTWNVRHFISIAPVGLEIRHP
jgi:predicted nucleic acid-binding protein